MQKYVSIYPLFQSNRMSNDWTLKSAWIGPTRAKGEGGGTHMSKEEDEVVVPWWMRRRRSWWTPPWCSLEDGAWTGRRRVAVPGCGGWPCLDAEMEGRRRLDGGGATVLGWRRSSCLDEGGMATGRRPAATCRLSSSLSKPLGSGKRSPNPRGGEHSAPGKVGVGSGTPELRSSKRQRN
jgi:hypothetical protein